MELVLWFECDNEPWRVLSMTANAHGVIRCKNILTGEIGYFRPGLIVDRVHVVIVHDK